MKRIEGVYAAYMTGKEGQGFALILFNNGIVSGADPLGVIFDGTYKFSSKNNVYKVKVRVNVPQGGTVIQGLTPDRDLSYDVELKLELNFLDLEFLPVETPLGAVNIKLKKIRELL